MNNDELKKKILSIVRGAMIEADELPFIETTDNIADALIAAGIGDVSSEKAMRELAEAFHREKCAEYDLLNYQMQKSEYRIAKAEHRAKVAERALKICLIDNLHCYECDMGFDGKCKGTDKEKEKCAMLEIDDYIQQAEKELEEERKDENN